MNTRYGGRHQAIRRAMLPHAYGKPCARCGLPMLPGQPLDLDHTDDRAGYLGFAHATCNRAAGARIREDRRRSRREGIARMLTTCALGIEISEDRRHTSIAAAGYVDADFILVELAAYIDGTDAAPAVVELAAARTVTATVLDPHSPAATLVKPLRDAGVALTEMSTHDVAVAHGQFLDMLNAGRLRHSGQPELTAAVRHGEERRLGGATAWQRRGIAVDVSPATAAELAVWALEHVVPPLPALVAWRGPLFGPRPPAADDNEEKEAAHMVTYNRRPAPKAEQPRSARDEAAARLGKEGKQ